MSDLAFDIHGERFDLPASAAYWRVRKQKYSGARGAPEVVFGPDGMPLILSVDTDITEFRKAVNDLAGRYRLDPLDERHRTIEDVPAAYIQITDPGQREKARSSEDDLMLRLVEANVEMTKAIADRFATINVEMVKSVTDKLAGIMEAAAHLLQAADGAGLPQRKPPDPEPRNGAGDDEEEDDDGEGNSDPPNFLEMLVPFVPLIQQAMSSKWSGGTTPPPPVAPRNAPTAGDGEEEQHPGSNGKSNGHGMPQLSPAQMAHLSAVYAKLTPDERTQAQQAAMLMPPEQRDAWLAELSGLTVDEAVELIRGAIAQTLVGEGNGGVS